MKYTSHLRYDENGSSTSLLVPTMAARARRSPLSNYVRQKTKPSTAQLSSSVPAAAVRVFFPSPPTPAHQNRRRYGPSALSAPAPALKDRNHPVSPQRASPFHRQPHHLKSRRPPAGGYLAQTATAYLQGNYTSAPSHRQAPFLRFNGIRPFANRPLAGFFRWKENRKRASTLTGPYGPCSVHLRSPSPVRRKLSRTSNPPFRPPNSATKIPKTVDPVPRNSFFPSRPPPLYPLHDGPARFSTEPSTAATVPPGSLLPPVEVACPSSQINGRPNRLSAPNSLPDFSSFGARRRKNAAAEFFASLRGNPFPHFHPRPQALRPSNTAIENQFPPQQTTGKRNAFPPFAKKCQSTMETSAGILSPPNPPLAAGAKTLPPAPGAFSRQPSALDDHLPLTFQHRPSFRRPPNSPSMLDVARIHGSPVRSSAAPNPAGAQPSLPTSQGANDEVSRPLPDFRSADGRPRVE